MFENAYKKDFWSFYSLLIVIIFAFLQVIRLPLFPQFMDIHYHLLTAQGFLRAGGYSGWDFWEYAPIGRPHIYPPVFHLILAGLLKTGISSVILAKVFECITPVLFLITLRYFLIKNYSSRLAFFVLISLCSSFSFYLSLINNIPATLALIFGILSLAQIFQRRIARSAILLALSFYTHIGISYFLAVSFIIYGFLDVRFRKECLYVCVSAIALSLPIIFKQVSAIKFISFSQITEKYFSEFKLLEYALALFGIYVVMLKRGKYWIFFSFFWASLIFFFYPYRFFSAQGYLPVILFSGIALEFAYEKLWAKKAIYKLLIVFLVFYVLFLTPTIILKGREENSKIRSKFYLFDSALTDMSFVLRNFRPASNSIWFPQDYLPAAELIKNNSGPDEIVYSNLDLSGIILANISGRPTANSLLLELKPHISFDPIRSSRIIILTRSEDDKKYEKVIDSYGLKKIGETRIFILYINPMATAMIGAQKASIPFWLIIVILIILLLIFLDKFPTYGIKIKLRRPG